MLDFTEKRQEFVSNMNVIQLREISSVKKTCFFKIKSIDIECFAVFKFGKLANLYCSPFDLKNLIVSGLYRENFISNEVSQCFKNSEINLQQVIDSLELENLMSGELIESLRLNFHSEFIQELLFDKSSEYFQVGQSDFIDQLKKLNFECVLEKAQLEEQFVGHLVLDSYVNRKKIEETLALGNCIDVNGIRNGLPKADQYADPKVPIEMILSKIPGLIGFSLRKLEECIRMNDLKLSDVVFEEVVPAVVESSSIVGTSDAVANQPLITNMNNSLRDRFLFFNLNNLGRVIEFFSLIGVFFLLFKIFTLVSVYRVLFLGI